MHSLLARTTCLYCTVQNYRLYFGGNGTTKVQGGHWNVGEHVNKQCVVNASVMQINEPK